MSTAKTHHPAKRTKENSTDATRGEPLALRAQKRKAELESILDVMPENALLARKDIEMALSEVDQWLLGDYEHLSKITGEDISRWLEATKHLAEPAPKPHRGAKH
jgi:CMP-N-acetylneuraminic acid synthetase